MKLVCARWVDRKGVGYVVGVLAYLAGGHAGKRVGRLVYKLASFGFDHSPPQQLTANHISMTSWISLCKKDIK